MFRGIVPVLCMVLLAASGPTAKCFLLQPNKASAGSVMFQQRSGNIEAIVTNPTLWGNNFPAVLQSLPAFSRAGERQVVVFSNRIVGRAKQQNQEQAQPNLRRLSEQIRANQKLTPNSPRISQFMAKPQVQLKEEVFHDMEDRSFRISAVAPQAQFLKADLTIAQVRKSLGKEEKVTTEVLDDGTERRPVILTLHIYAGGAVIFAESDFNPHPGSVDRVLLDAAAVSSALFKEAK